MAAALAETDIGLIGVPFDGGVTNRSGARHGPRAVREQSTLLRRINAATGVTPFASARVRDLGDCWLEQPFALEGALEEIAAFYRPVVGAGVVPLSVGGDHSISLPILRAVARAPAGRHGAYRRALRHRRRLPGLALPPRRAVPPRGGGGRAGPARG